MDGLLRILTGKDAGKTVHLTPGRDSIAGRLPENDVWLSGNDVSRTHCLFQEQDGVWVVSDMGSHNGTFVNGNRVDKDHGLRNGDQVTVGPVDMLFTVAAEGPCADAQAGPPAEGRPAAVAGVQTISSMPWPSTGEPEHQSALPPARPASPDAPGVEPVAAQDGPASDVDAGGQEAPEGVTAAPRTWAMPRRAAMCGLAALTIGTVLFCVVVPRKFAVSTPGPAWMPRPGKAKSAPAPAAARAAAPEASQAASAQADDPAARRRTETLSRVALGEYRSKNYGAAAVLYSEVIAIDCGCTSYAYFMRGLARTQLTQFKQAIADFTTALECPCVCREALYAARANAYVAKGDCAGAIRDCTEAIRANPKFTDAYYLRGLAHIEVGKLQEAKEDFDEVLARKRDDAQALRARAKVHAALGQHDSAKQDAADAAAIEKP